MRVLFVCAEVPTRQHIRSYGFLHALAGRGHQITVVCGVAAGCRRHIADLWDLGIRVLAIAQGRAGQHRQLLHVLTQPLTAYPPALLAAVRREAASGAYDIAHIAGMAVSGLGPALVGMPAVLDAASCASLTLIRRSREGWRQGMRAAFGLVRTRYHEASYLESYERVIASSHDDAWALGMLARHYGASAPGIHMIPSPIIPDEQASSILTLREQDALFLCSDQASRDRAILRLVESVMPQIWRQRADVRLLVAGPLPASLRRGSRADPRILSVGRDHAQAISRSTIALAPGATESADSALQALSCGTPLIASRSIGRALAASDGRNILLADEPAEQARAVLALLDDPRYRGQIGRAGRAHAEQQHAPDQITSELEQVYAAARGISIADWNLTMGLSQLHSREVGS